MARQQRRAGRSGASSAAGSWLSFATGLSIGSFIAFLVYLYARAPGAGAPAAPQTGPGGQLGTGAPSATEPGGPPPAGKDSTRFDFYTILPETEVKVPEWQGEESTNAPAAQSEPGSYVLQVGSFQRFEEADRAKAELALQGVSASIQKVAINNGDTWYRVRVGPIEDAAELSRTRERLTAAGTNFMLLKLKPGATE